MTNMSISREAFNETIAKMYAPFTFGSKYVFYINLLAQCNIQMTDKIPTAGVCFSNGRYHLKVNPEFFEKHTLQERAAIIEHEMHHILNGHCIGLRLKEEKNSTLKNIAFDTAINQNIDGLPDSALTPESLEKELSKKGKNIQVLKNKESEYYYYLLNEIKDELKNDSNGGESGSGEPLDNLETLDDHSEMIQNEVSNGDFDEELAKDITKKMIDKAVSATNDTNPGSVPSMVDEYIKLFRSKSQVNWKKEIKRTLSSKRLDKTKTFKKRNRRQPDRIELKGSKKEYSHDVLVVLDSSGSVSSTDQNLLLNEIKSICEAVKSEVTLIQVDTEACEPEKIKAKTNIFHRKKSGGTFLTPALEKAKQRKLQYQTLLVCTDGYLMDEDFKAFYNVSLTGRNVIWLIDSSGVIKDEMKKGSQRAFKIERIK